MNIPDNPLARRHGLVVHEMPGEVLVYDMERNKGHCLNQSAALVWKCCDGSSSVGDIAGQFESNGGGKVTEDFVWMAIDQLSENSLLENTVTPRFAGQSRRQVLKKVGLASMVAMPVIASLVQPRNALSNLNCACISSAQCASPSMAACPSRTNCNQNGVCAP